MSLEVTTAWCPWRPCSLSGHLVAGVGLELCTCAMCILTLTFCFLAVGLSDTEPAAKDEAPTEEAATERKGRSLQRQTIKGAAPVNLGARVCIQRTLNIPCRIVAALFKYRQEQLFQATWAGSQAPHSGKQSKGGLMCDLAMGCKLSSGSSRCVCLPFSGESHSGLSRVQHTKCDGFD